MRHSFLKFLQQELQPRPGRSGLSWRITVSCGLIILISMTLQIPFLAVSLIVVFYTCQSNSMVTALIGVVFVVTITTALFCSLLILKFTIGYPLLGLACSSVLLLVSTYLLRVVQRIGTAFFLVALVVINVQTFPDLTDQAEVMVRLILWIWIAVIYAIGVTVLVNFCFGSANPAYQLRQLSLYLLAQVQAALQAISHRRKPAYCPSLYDVADSHAQLEQCFKLAVHTDNGVKTHKSLYASHISAVLRLYNAVAQLRVSPVATPEERQQAGSLGAAVAQYRRDMRETPDRHSQPLSLPAGKSCHIALEEIERTLQTLSRGHNVTLPPDKRHKQSLLVPDAFKNPVYIQFALKTLFATLICYLFYQATDWHGIHTIMLTCVIVAQPSLGTTLQKSLLRVGGAILGSLLALFVVIFVQPYTDSIVGLLLMTLPIMATGAWIAAGSERISYAGTQLVFTFALALLDNFGPATNLTEIRDRITGILLGVAVSMVFHLYLWPDSELPLLKKKLAALYRLVADHMHKGHDMMASPRLMQTLDETRSMVNHVVLEQLHDSHATIHGKPTPPVQETMDRAAVIIQLVNLCHAHGWRDEPAMAACAALLKSYADHILTPASSRQTSPAARAALAGRGPLHALAYTITTLPNWHQAHGTWMQDSP